MTRSGLEAQMPRAAMASVRHSGANSVHRKRARVGKTAENDRNDVVVSMR
jgi:hypothetical protein